MTAPKLRNDCFAMPPGVDWVPVDEALERLEAGLEILARTEWAISRERCSRAARASALLKFRR